MSLQNFLQAAICICLFLDLGARGQSSQWRGIVLLHSTRHDVERVIGAPITPNGTSYELNDARVTITYSEGTCEKGRTQWAVKPDTVVSIKVYPRGKLSLRDLNMDPSRFEKSVDPHLPDYTVIASKQQGVSVRLTANGDVDAYEYFPSTKDDILRCPSGENRVVAINDLRYFQFDEYSGLSVANENERLKNFAARLRGMSDTVGYIVGYEQRKTSASLTKQRLARAKNYLIKYQRIPTERIVIKQGGFDANGKVELYVVPVDIHLRYSAATTRK